MGWTIVGGFFAVAGGPAVGGGVLLLGGIRVAVDQVFRWTQTAGSNFLASQGTKLGKIYAFYMLENEYNHFRDGVYQVHIVVFNRASPSICQKHFGVLLTTDDETWLLHATFLRCPASYQKICGIGNQHLELSMYDRGECAVLLQRLPDVMRRSGRVLYSSFGDRQVSRDTLYNLFENLQNRNNIESELQISSCYHFTTDCFDHLIGGIPYVRALSVWRYRQPLNLERNIHHNFRY